jgi:uncharacterized DUF497 family protein
MSFEWDPRKDEENFKKHGVRFAEAVPVLVTIMQLRARTMNRTRMNCDLSRSEQA